MIFLNLNESVKTAIKIAQSIAGGYGNGVYTPARLLKYLMHKEVGLRRFIDYLGKDISFFEEWAEIRINEYPKVGAQTEITGDEKYTDRSVKASHVLDIAIIITTASVPVGGWAIALGYIAIDAVVYLITNKNIGGHLNDFADKNLRTKNSTLIHVSPILILP